MKALTIKQPWASLIALGEKQFETRSWATKHRGELAIHAGKSVDKEACEEFADVLKSYGIHSIKDLPTGAVIATAELVDCHRVVDGCPLFAVTDKDKIISDKEFRYGFYDVGRHAWELKQIKQLEQPIPAKGQLSLWNWEG